MQLPDVNFWLAIVFQLMFSVDGGRTWRDHRVISDRASFNYTAIREIRPGRLPVERSKRYLSR